MIQAVQNQLAWLEEKISELHRQMLDVPSSMMAERDRLTAILQRSAAGLPNFQPVTISADALARAMDEPKLLDAARKRQEAALAKMPEWMARPSLYISPDIAAFPAPKDNDSIEIRCRYWASTVAPPRVVFYADLDPPRIDPLDAVIDGRTLRWCLAIDESSRRLENHGFTLSPAQRAAVSSHWSAELCARITAAKAKERNVVTYCEVDADD